MRTGSPASAFPSGVSGARWSHVSWPQQLPSFFHSRCHVPSSARNVEASIAPPSSSRHTSIWSPTTSNGPSGESATATPTHCTYGRKFVVVK